MKLWYPRCALSNIDCDLGCFLYASAARQWRIVEIQLLAAFDRPWKSKETRLPHVRQGCPFSSNPIAKTFHSLEDQTVGKGELLSWESQSSSNIARVGVWVVNQWSVMDSNYFSPYIFWPKICPRSFQATQNCHSEVSNRCFGLWSPRSFVSIFRCRPHVSMFEKCDAVPKGDLFDMFVWGIHCRYSLLQRHSTHEDIRKSVRVDYWVANPARTSPGSMFELWISDGFELFFAVHFLYPKFVLARPKQLILMPVTVKFRLYSCGISQKATKQWTIVEIDLLATLGWKWGCHPASCPCWQNVTQCQTRFVRHVCFRNPFPIFIFAKTFNSWRHQKVGKGGLLSCESSSNIARVGVWVVNQWWISPYIFCT